MGDRYIHVLANGTRKAAILCTSVVVVCAILLWSFYGSAFRAPIASAETQFVEHSTSGLQIVPASCPSDPHYSGECGAAYSEASYGGPGGKPGYEQASYGSYSQPGYYGQASYLGSPPTVTLTSDPVCVAGTPFAVGMIPYDPDGGAVNFLYFDGVAGSMQSSGYVQFQHTITPIYSAGYHTVDAMGIDTEGLSSDWVHLTFYCTSSYSQSYYQGCYSPNTCSSDYKRVVDSCSGTTVQVCGSNQTCSAGQCVDISASLTVVPSLVRSGDTTTVTWSGQNVSSCTVTENNSGFDNSWSCNSISSCAATHTQTSSAIDQETIYTLVCTAQSGARVTKTGKVSVIPVWNEPPSQ